jgi:putative copper resistance protein D
VWFLHSPYAKFITHPIFVLIIYTVGLYGLYYTTFFGTLMGAHAGHVFMQVHFIVAGYLFYWVVIGIDPTPRQVPYWGRMLLLLLSLVIHSFFALPMLMAGTAMAQEWYGLVQPPWLTDQLADTRLAGGIAWGFGEIPTLIVIIALSVQWARSDAREAKRHDRKADRDGDSELHAYNDRLARMNARAEKGEVTRSE